MTKRLKTKLFRAEYCALWNAIDRCHNEKATFYDRYGARGITVCDKFRDPVAGMAAFLAEVGPRPSDKHSLDRIDNDLGYQPGNLRWATRAEQQNNRSATDTTARDLGWGIGRHTFIRNGVTVNFASSLIEYNGKCQTVAEWSQELGISSGTITSRLRRKWPLGKVLSPFLFSPHHKPRASQEENNSHDD